MLTTLSQTVVLVEVSSGMAPSASKDEEKLDYSCSEAKSKVRRFLRLFARTEFQYTKNDLH